MGGISHDAFLHRPLFLLHFLFTDAARVENAGTVLAVHPPGAGPVCAEHLDARVFLFSGDLESFYHASVLFTCAVIFLCCIFSVFLIKVKNILLIRQE